MIMMMITINMTISGSCCYYHSRVDRGIMIVCLSQRWSESPPSDQPYTKGQGQEGYDCVLGLSQSSIKSPPSDQLYSAWWRKPAVGVGRKPSDEDATPANRARRREAVRSLHAVERSAEETENWTPETVCWPKRRNGERETGKNKRNTKTVKRRNGRRGRDDRYYIIVHHSIVSVLVY